MSNFFVALYAVLPMFIMLAIGFTVRKMKVIEEAHLPVLNKIVFNVFFPFLMFNNIYAFDLSADFNASLLFVCGCCRSGYLRFVGWFCFNF